MILPWQTGPPKCGQTFSKAVKRPLTQNTPISASSTATICRPESGNSDTLPITTSRIGLPRPPVPHREVEQADVDRPQHLAHDHDYLRRGDPLRGEGRRGVSPVRASVLAA